MRSPGDCAALSGPRRTLWANDTLVPGQSLERHPAPRPSSRCFPSEGLAALFVLFPEDFLHLADFLLDLPPDLFVLAFSG
jgi:hypothetical protein